MTQISEGYIEFAYSVNEVRMMVDLDQLMSEMEILGASDLFFRPDARPAARINGKVQALKQYDPVSQESIEEFIDRVLAQEHLSLLRSKGELDLGYSPPKGGRCRLNFHKQMGRFAITARSLVSHDLNPEALNLPFSLAKLADHNSGLILVTGATGAGKTTTLAALTNVINSSRQVHIVSIEDPIEFVHLDLQGIVTQRQVGTDTQSFSTALRNVVRESPDVIVIGELRDIESVEVAISAALTGHLVLATLHTTDAAQTIQRLLSFFPEDRRPAVCSDLSACLRGIVSMRLLPRADMPGRIPAVEILNVTPGVAHVIRQQRYEDIPDLMRGSDDTDTQTFQDSLLKLLDEEKITFKAGCDHATNPDAFRLAVAGLRTGVSSFKGEVEKGSEGLIDFRGLLSHALEIGASDVHLTAGRSPIFRVDGVLKPMDRKALTSAQVRWILYSLLTGHQQAEFELERELDLCLTVEHGLRFRMNAYHQKGRIAAALRLIPSEIPEPEQLGLPWGLCDLTNKAQGLILTVGPTGSGKSTTNASLVDKLNREKACHIITIEDPIEYVHHSKTAVVEQREIHSDTKSFSRALKNALRQDPDVIVVGEMRDPETIAAVLTAAETGHLVFATLHTNDAAQTIDRIVDVFPPHQQPQVQVQLSGVLLGIASQRLLPRADGTGRIAAFEFLHCNPAVRACIRAGKTHQIPNVIQTSANEGMIPMDTSLAKLYEEGLVDVEAALPHMSEPDVLYRLIPQTV
jgi:pilus retraction protein PilT